MRRVTKVIHDGTISEEDDPSRHSVSTSRVMATERRQEQRHPPPTSATTTTSSLNHKQNVEETRESVPPKAKHQQQQLQQHPQQQDGSLSMISTATFYSHWHDFWGNSKISEEFQEFRLHDGSNHVYLLMMMLFIVLIGSMAVPMLDVFPMTYLTHYLVVYNIINLIVVIVLTIFKIGTMIRHAIEVRERERHGFENEEEEGHGWLPGQHTSWWRKKKDAHPIHRNESDGTDTNTGSHQLPQHHHHHYIHHKRVGRLHACLETICAALITFGLVLYVGYMVVLRHDYDYDKRDVPTLRALPEGLAAASVMMPILMYMVFKQLPFRYAIYIMVLAFVGNMIVLGMFDLHVSLPRSIIATALTMFILCEYHRQVWHSFMISNQLVKTLDENARLAEEVKATELRHMIGNVAHDLKTPLSSFISGMEVIRLVANELQCDMKDATASNVPAMQEKVSTILEVAENVTNTNAFMIMTINRCIDYNKTLFGVKLLPKNETFLLRDSIDFIMKCLQGMHNQWIDCQYKSGELKKGEIMLKTDKQWMQENLLCLIGNAMRYTPHNKKVILELSVIRKPIVAATSQGLLQGSSMMVSNGSQESLVTANISGAPSEQGLSTFPPGSSTTSLMAVKVNHWPSSTIIGGSADRSAIYDIEEGISSNTAIGGGDQALPLFASSSPKSGKSGKSLSSATTTVPVIVGSNNVVGSASSTSSSDSFLKMSVIDAGPGVDVQFRSKLFQEPVQAARLSGGTGLGLYSLARRVETLGGEFGIEDRPDGEQGSLFWFTVPFRQQACGVNAIGGASLPSTKQLTNSANNVINTSCAASTDASVAHPNSLSLSKGAIWEVPSIRGQGLRHQDSSTGSIPREASLIGLGNTSPTTDNNKPGSSGDRSRGDNHQVRRFSVSSMLSDGEHSISIGHRSRHLAKSRSKSRGLGRDSATESSLRQAVDDAAVAVAGQSQDPSSSLDESLRLSPAAVAPLPPPRVELPKQLTVLVVDDSLPILKMTSLALRKQGHNVVTAENGADAVKTFQHHLSTGTPLNDDSTDVANALQPFDVILMDFQMPIMDGLEAISKVRDVEQEYFVKSITAAATKTTKTTSSFSFPTSSNQEVVIIGFSAKSDEYQIEEGYSKGMDAFLPKPFTIAAFQSILQSFIQQQQQQFVS